MKQYLAHGDHLQDPQLESMGKENAKKTGAWLHDILIKALKVNVDNIAFHTSSLERCISTAELVMQEMGCKGEPLYVHDGLREWVGYDHQSNTDKRNTRTQIEGRHKAVKLRYLESFPEDDELFVKIDGKIKELWVDVGIRWVRSLVSAFTRKRTLKYIILVSNNRAIQCGLRELGLAADEESMANSKLPEKLVVQDMKNAGVMALVVKQINFDKEDFLANWHTLRVKDEANTLTLRDMEKALADEQAGNLTEKQYEEVKEQLSGPRPDDWRHIQEVWLEKNKSQK